VKTELRVQPHNVLPGHLVVEVWYDGRLIATVTGADGPGVLVISNHAMQALPVPGDGLPLVMQVSVRAEEGTRP
jgi:hypothetical protein